MNGRLVLAMRDWGDGSGELRADVRVGEFSGAGHANFNLQTLRDFAQALLKYPFDLGETIEIQGGYWDATEPKRVTDEHLYIGVSPVGVRGNLVATIRLACPYDEPEKSGVRYSVAVELDLNYGSLANFASDLAALLGGEVGEVVVDAVD
jgi:hypothetical protein